MHVTLFFRFNSKRASALIALETSIVEAPPNFFFSLFLAQFDRKELRETDEHGRATPHMRHLYVNVTFPKLGYIRKNNLAEDIEKKK